MRRPKKISWLNLCLSMVYEYVPYRIETVDDTVKFSNIASHAFSIAGFAQKRLNIKKKHRLMTADVYDAIGYCYCSLGEYSSSLVCYENALYTYKEECGSQSPTIAALYNNVGELYNDWGIVDKAYNYYYSALLIRKKLFGIKNEFTAQSYNNVGTIWCIRSKYKLAYQYYKKAIKIRKKIYGRNAFELSTSYNTLGDLYFREGQLRKALTYFKKDVELIAEHDEEHPDLISGETNIGNIYSSLGDFEKALSFYSNALFLSIKLKRGEHPFTGTIYNNIGFIYECAIPSNMKYTDFALENYKKALAIRVAKLGEINAETAQTINNIGNVLLYNQDISGAEERYKSALAIREKIFGRDNSETMISYSCIASIYHIRGDFDNALINYSIAIDISRTIGLRNQNVAKIFQNIGDIYLEIKKFYDALYAFLACYKILLNIVDTHNSDVETACSCMKYAFAQLNYDKDFYDWLENEMNDFN